MIQKFRNIRIQNQNWNWA